jgi:hypothetical protein
MAEKKKDDPPVMRGEGNTAPSHLRGGYDAAYGGNPALALGRPGPVAHRFGWLVGPLASSCLGPSAWPRTDPIKSASE